MTQETYGCLEKSDTIYGNTYGYLRQTDVVFIYTGLALACPTDPCTQVLLTNTISCNSSVCRFTIAILSSAVAYGSPEEEEENERVLRIKEDDSVGATETVQLVL